MRRSHILLNRAFGHVDAQLEQFPTNAFRTPQVIVAGHGLNQPDRLCRKFRLPGSCPGALPPEPAEQVAMPSQEGVRLDNQERLFPTAGSPCKDDQEQPIGLGTNWALHLTAENGELLTEQGVLSDEFRTGAGQIAHGAGQDGVTRRPRPVP